MPTGFLDSNFYIQNALIQLLACKYPTHVKDVVITLKLVKVLCYLITKVFYSLNKKRIISYRVTALQVHLYALY